MDDLVGLARVAREHGRHELVGIMCLEPCGLHREDRIGCRMRLVERILRELEDVVPDPLSDGAGVPVAHGTVEPVVGHGLLVAIVPLADLLRHEIELLLRHRLAQLVGLAGGETAHLHRDLHDLLLVDDRAVRRLEDVPEALVIVDDGLGLGLAPDEIIDHTGVERTGTVEGDDGDDVRVTVGLHPLEQRDHARRLDLENAGGVPTREETVDGRVVEGDLVLVYLDAETLPDVLLGLGDEGEGTQSEEVHLEQTERRGRRAIELRDDHATLGVILDRHVPVDRIAADDDRACMDTLPTGDPLEGERGVDDLLHIRIFLIELREIGVALERTLDGRLRAIRYHLRDALTVAHAVAEDARRIVDSLLRLHRREGDHMCDLLRAVQLTHVVDDLLAPFIIEVEIDIGHLRTLRGEEALEDQVVLKWVERRDIESVADDGACSRTTPRPHADTMRLRPMGELLHDEEVGGKPLVADDLVFMLEPVEHLLGQRFAIAPLEPLESVLAKQGLVGLALGTGEPREHDAVEIDRHVALLRDLHRVVDAFRKVGERLSHLLLALHVRTPEGMHAVLVIDVRGGTDAEHVILRRHVLGIKVMDVVGADRLDTDLMSELVQRDVELVLRGARIGPDALVLELDVEITRREELLERERPALGFLVIALVDEFRDDARYACGRAYEPLCMLAQHGQVDTWLVIIAVDRSLGHEPDEVVVPGIVLGKQDHVVEGGLVVTRELIIVDEISLTSQDGLDRLPFPLLLDRLVVPHAGLIEGDHAIHVTMVGDCQGGHAELRRPLDQVLDTGGAIEQRVFGVHVEVGERHGMLPPEAPQPRRFPPQERGPSSTEKNHRHPERPRGRNRVPPHVPGARSAEIELLEHVEVTIRAIVQGLGDTRDRGRRGAGALLYGNIRIAPVEHVRDGKTLGHVLDLPDGADILEKREDIIGVGKEGERLEQLLDLLCSHAVRHDASSQDRRRAPSAPSRFPL